MWYAGISATSEDIPNKIEDLRSECSSDFGGKDSVTSPDGEESGHGRRTAFPAFSAIYLVKSTLAVLHLQHNSVTPFLPIFIFSRARFLSHFSVPEN